GWTGRRGGGLRGRGGVAVSRCIDRVAAMEAWALMAPPAKCMAEPLDVGGVSAEAVPPKERRDHGEFHGRPPCRDCSMMRLPRFDHEAGGASVLKTRFHISV